MTEMALELVVVRRERYTLPSGADRLFKAPLPLHDVAQPVMQARIARPKFDRPREPRFGFFKIPLPRKHLAQMPQQVGIIG
jgi:hypothetical protein